MPREDARYGPPSVDKALGALPVVAEFCRRLDIAGIVDRSCPVREVAIVTHGQVIEALIANRLTSPTPLVHVEHWARAWATEEIFGIDPNALNDDRIGRASMLWPRSYTRSSVRSVPKRSRRSVLTCPGSIGI